MTREHERYRQARRAYDPTQTTDTRFIYELIPLTPHDPARTTTVTCTHCRHTQVAPWGFVADILEAAGWTPHHHTGWTCPACPTP